MSRHRVLIRKDSKKSEFPKEPLFFCRVKHRAVVWTPAPKKHIPGGGFLRLKVLFAAYPGWKYVWGDPDYTPNSVGFDRPTVNFSMGDYSHTFHATDNQIVSFRRPGSDYGLSTVVFDAIFRLKFRPGPVAPNHVNVQAHMLARWIEPYVGPGNNPVDRKAHDTWTSGKALNNYEIDTDLPFLLSPQGGFHEYRPPIQGPLPANYT